ncbi:helix-turn-helix DNA-binding protein [Gordonia phage DatBoi]|nr:helix-turn-helix DNA-binding protein [Gordonia phage DatBoi]
MDVHPSTVSRVIRGTNARGARPEFVTKLAKALKRKPETVAGWAGERWESGLETYTPPDGSETLTLRQREAADRMIRAFIEINRRERSRRALDSKMVRGLAERLGRTRAEVADALEEIEAGDE